jgi:TolA-binding protein
MQRVFLTCCLLAIVAVVGCSGDKAQELLQTAELEERQHNVAHAKQPYDDIIRLYPSSKEAAIARSRSASLNQGR